MVVEFKFVELSQQAVAGALIGDCVPFFDEVVGLFGICSVFDLDLDTVRDPSIK